MSSYKISIVQQNYILKYNKGRKTSNVTDKRRAYGLTQKGNERLKELRIKEKLDIEMPFISKYMSYSSDLRGKKRF